MNDINIGGNIGQPRLNVGLNELDDIVCECGGRVYSEGVMIKRVSAILTGTGKGGVLPIPIFYCISCNKVVNELLPEELRGGVIRGGGNNNKLVV